MMQPSYDLAACRAEIPLLSSLIPMNSCSQAPQTTVTRAAAERYLESWNRHGMDWETWIAEVELAKRAFATLINASPDEIAVFSSVSEATSAVASAIDFSARRTVVVTEAEFPTVGHVWLAQARRGARVRWIPVSAGAIDVAEYDRCIDDDTAVVSACHGYYLNGFMQDLGTLATRAHAQGALLYVDAYQTLGAVPVDVRAMDVDLLASGNLKFLMGVPGVAFLYVRSELITTLEPAVTGWFGRVDPFAFRVKELDWPSAARRFDTGTPPVINTYIARAGMELINAIGVANIRAWLEVLACRLMEGGRARGFTLHGTADLARKTSTTAFVVPDAHAVELAMRQRGIVCAARGPVIRLAPHYFNSVEDVDTSLDALASIVRPS